MKIPAEKAFTLIEILLVVAIIGLLASVVLASLSQSKVKANTAKRLENAKQLENALEVYYVNNNRYPSTCSPAANTCAVASAHLLSTCSTWGTDIYTTWIPGLAPNFIATLPTDPDSDGVAKCCYLYKSNGTDYKLMIAYGAVGANACTPVVGSYGAYPRYIDPQRDTTPNDGKQNWNGVTTLYDWAVYSTGGAQF